MKKIAFLLSLLYVSTLSFAQGFPFPGVRVPASGGGTPPTIVQACFTGSGNCTFSTNVTIGNSVACFYYVIGSGADMTSVTGENSEMFTQSVPTQTPAANTGQQPGFYFLAATTGAWDEVSHTQNGSTSTYTLFCEELTPGHYDTFSYASSASSGGTLTTTGADILLSFTSAQDGTLVTPMGWTLDGMGAPNWYVYYYDKAEATPGMYAFTYAMSGGDILTVGVKQ